MLSAVSPGIELYISIVLNICHEFTAFLFCPASDILLDDVQITKPPVILSVRRHSQNRLESAYFSLSVLTLFSLLHYCMYALLSDGAMK
jgi:hypothetical protein